MTENKLLAKFKVDKREYRIVGSKRHIHVETKDEDALGALRWIDIEGFRQDLLNVILKGFANGSMTLINAEVEEALKEEDTSKDVRYEHLVETGILTNDNSDKYRVQFENYPNVRVEEYYPYVREWGATTGISKESYDVLLGRAMWLLRSYMDSSVILAEKLKNLVPLEKPKFEGRLSPQLEGDLLIALNDNITTLLKTLKKKK